MYMFNICLLLVLFHHLINRLMSEAAEQMFKMAKERVYKVVPLSNIVDESAILGSTTSCNSNSLVRKGGSNKVLAVTKLFKQQQQNQSGNILAENLLRYLLISIVIIFC